MFNFVTLGPTIRISWRDVLDISLVTFVLYRLILLVKGTRAVSVIYGLLLVLMAYFLSSELGFYTLNWLLTNFLSYLFLMVIILFQKDIYKALTGLGAYKIWRRPVVRDESLDALVAAAAAMAATRTGALIVIERNVPLGDVVARGIRVGGHITRELLETIFFPKTQLHDGAVVVQGDEIAAAGCILPLAVGSWHRSDLGTRHRAALGISDESDAVVIVVSEESGSISLAAAGQLKQGLDEETLRWELVEALAANNRKLTRTGGRSVSQPMVKVTDRSNNTGDMAAAVWVNGTNVEDPGCLKNSYDKQVNNWKEQ
ncbi:diadenylate cyclase [Desulfovibrionales bacterium]